MPWIRISGAILLSPEAPSHCGKEQLHLLRCFHKTAKSFIVSFRPSVRKEHLGSQWTHTQNMKYVLLFHCNTGCMNASQCLLYILCLSYFLNKHVIHKNCELNKCTVTLLLWAKYYCFTL